MSNLESGLRDSLADRYRLIRPLGAGAMAEVFLAEDVRHHREVAIKALRPELAAVLGPERFEQEIAFAARLNHPNILPLLDSGVAAGTLYYTMPYAAGESLRDRLGREKQLPIGEALALGEQVARALDYAHRQGVIHRDIKPENILLVDRQAIVADFGIARAVRSAAGARLTESGTTIGTPLYMSPEQSAGDREVDGRSDEYSLACVVHEMLAGQPPFVAPMAETVLYQHMTATPRAVTELRPSTPAGAATAVLRALAKSPADRYATAGEFADALAAARATATVGAGVAATAPMPAQPARAPEPAIATAAAAGASPGARRARAGLWIGVAVVVLAAAGLAAFRAGWLDRVLGHAPAPTRRQWVMLADFDGPPDDPSLASVARDLVGAALDQSTLTAVVPRDQMRIALRLAGRSDTSRVDAELARELAYRSSMRMVVDGAVRRVGAGYSIVLHATDAEDGRALFTAVGTARGSGDLVAALGAAAKRLRRGLGENAAAVNSTRELPMAATPSFEAYKLYARGRALMTNNEGESSLHAFRSALALDPDFAMAWLGIATLYMNSLMPDSARVAAHEALSRPQRLTEFARLDLEAKLARLDGDMPKALQLYDELLAANLTPVERAIAYNNKGTVFDVSNQTAEALECYKAAVDLWPIQPSALSLGNVAGLEIALGRNAEARATLERMPPETRFGSDIQLSMIESQWSRAESLATVAIARTSGEPFDRILAFGSLWGLALRRGEVTRATGVIGGLQQIALSQDTGVLRSAVYLFGNWTAMLTSRPAAVGNELISGQSRPLTEMFALALRGDTASAARSVQRVVSNIPPLYRDDISNMVQGVADLRGGAPRRGLMRVAGPAHVGFFDGHPVFETFRVMTRWIAADEFDREGMTDSTFVYLNLIADPPGHGAPATIMRTAAWPFVQRRLALLEAHRGHYAASQQHWLAFEESFSRPDPDLTPLVEETRAALQATGAMGAPEKR